MASKNSRCEIAVGIDRASRSKWARGRTNMELMSHRQPSLVSPYQTLSTLFNVSSLHVKDFLFILSNNMHLVDRFYERCIFIELFTLNLAETEI